LLIRAGKQKDSSIDNGEAIVNVKSAECLVLVAIVASSAAVQMREHLAEPAARHASLNGPSAPACGNGMVAGVLTARCDMTQGARGVHGERHIGDARPMSRQNTGRYSRPRSLWV
jgi:hypothetical protein